jgi:hypothetical protein
VLTLDEVDAKDLLLDDERDRQLDEEPGRRFVADALAGRHGSPGRMRSFPEAPLRSFRVRGLAR